jgi:hypothetical protein
MTLSVAMCTYNGASFLSEQLHSIAMQRLLPDELIVCDDGSSDATVGVLRRFAATAPFPVRIHVNPHTIGYAKNFEKAISLCTAELIAPCDQDDVWAANKLLSSVRLLEDQPDVGLVCTDAEIVDAGLKSLGVRMQEALGFGPAEQALVAGGNALLVLVRRNFVTGATMAFRSNFLPDVLPIPQGWVHDGWIALMISLQSRLAFIDEPLVRYRQHGANQIGAPRTMGLGELLSPAVPAQVAALQDAARWRLASQRAPADISRGDLKLLLGKERHTSARADLGCHRLLRLPAIAGQLLRGNYHRYSAGAGSAVKDLVTRRACHEPGGADPV